MAKSFQTIRDNLIARIQANVENADTKLGSFLRDTIIDPTARVLREVYSRVQDAALAQSPVVSPNEDLVSLAENFQIYRKGATKASGTVKFFRSTAPPSDITIAAGKTITTRPTATSEAVAFRTTETVTMNSATPSIYLNADTGKYEIEAAVEAVQGGSSGNKPTRTIVVLSDAVSGIEGVYNASATVGGSDQESYDALRTRLLAAIQGTNIGTKAGYANLVKENESVEQSIVLAASDDGAIREAAGAVDIIIKGTVSRNASDTYNPAVSGVYPDYVFQSQPWVYSAASGSVSVVSSKSGSLSRGTHFEIVKDTGSYGGSTIGRDRVQWLAGVTDNEYGSLTIGYAYNSLISTLQTLVDSVDKHSVGADVIVKDAIPVGIDLELTIDVGAGYDPTSVASNVVSALSSLIEALSIGEDVSQAELVAEALSVGGCDDVTVPFTTFQSTDGTITQDSESNLPIPSLYRATAGTITVNTS